jgi:selenide, water dikinase
MEFSHDPNILAGIQGSEDAGVYKISDQLALVQTVDFFTPIVDDPIVFGMAAAANSLSDIYAMGAKPLTAMNIVCFPVTKLGIEILRSILQGGLEILKEAGVALIGGHSVEDEEPKYGLSVTGLIHPEKIMTNGGLVIGDDVILTKALGTGLIATAIKADLASPASTESMIKSVCSLNRTSSEAALKYGVRACTDVTGFGLAGHLVEMARASSCKVKVYSKNVPALDGALEAASMGLVPAGAYRNREFFSGWISSDPNIPQEIGDLLFDPQTSGGLLVGIAKEKSDELLKEMQYRGVLAAKIGEVIEKSDEGLIQFAN